MKRVLIFIVLLALLALPLTASAENTYKTYFYDVWGDPIASPDGYDVERTLSGKTLGIGDFSMPQDLFVYQGRVYLIRVISGSSCWIKTTRWWIKSGSSTVERKRS